MRYQESVERSAECLRLALPLMSRQAAPLHPLSYSIWYEHVAGINKPLSGAIEDHVNDGKVLDDEATAELYRTYIAERDRQIAHRVTTGFKRVMENVSQDAASAGAEVNRFGSTLEHWTGEFGNQSLPQVSGDEFHRLLSGTREMQKAMAILNARLEESRKEIGRLQEEVSRARDEALADGLTELANRRGFEIALASCLADSEMHHTETCLLFADIDHFKRINDAYGHLMGDKVLKSVAQVLKANIKGKDTAARFGGEEFVVLLPETSVEGACVLAEKIRTMIEGSRIRRADSRQEIARITASFGVAHHSRGESAGDFLARADAALYASKTQGRNRVTLARAGSVAATASC